MPHIPANHYNPGRLSGSRPKTNLPDPPVQLPPPPEPAATEEARPGRRVKLLESISLFNYDIQPDDVLAMMTGHGPVRN